MCGIACIAPIGRPIIDSDKNVVKMMASRLQHRGPDNTDYSFSGGVAFAFNRLALVGGELGRQPFHLQSAGKRRLTLVANGEIYNHAELERQLGCQHILQGTSDCEVLIHLLDRHGDGFLKNINGMISVIAHDEVRNKLILARDRFGIKPLYYHLNTERVVAGSEIKSLFADPETPRAIDWASALNNQYLQSNTQPSTVNEVSTWYVGITQVKPGTVVEIDLTDGSVKEATYWALPASTDQIGSRQSYTEKFHRLLEDSVRDCATADAELGLFLSGGVDSAVIAALAHKHTSLHTFSVRTPATVENGDAYYARAVADKFGIPNHQADLTRVPEFDEWRNFLALLENPMAGMEAYYKYELHRFAKELRPDLKGMLLGAAADEYYGGYTADYGEQTSWRTFISVISEMFRNDTQIAQSVAWKTAGVPLVKPAETADPYRVYLSYEHAKLYQYNVWHEDRTAAGSGIEARVPFLDHRLIELAASLPVKLRESLLWDKRMVREAAASVLPQEIAERIKTPFYYGPGESHAFNMAAELLEKDNRALVDLALSTPDSQLHLNELGIHSALDRYQEHPDSVNIEQVLNVVNLGVMSANLSTDFIYKHISQKTPIEISNPVAKPQVGTTTGTYVLSPDIRYLTSLAGDTCYLAHRGQLVYEIISGTAWDRVFTRLATTDDNLIQAMEASSVTNSEIHDQLQDCISSGYLVPGDA